MRRASIALALALVFIGIPVLACSEHGTNAANQINNWLNGAAANNTLGGSDTATDGGNFDPFVTVTGGQSNPDQSHGGSFVRDSYWVEITGPNGYTQKITATTQAGRTTVKVTDKDGKVLNTITIDDGAELEMFLRDTATDVTVLLSRAVGGGASADNFSGKAVFTDDGTKIIFESYASDLVAGDFNLERDVFVAQLQLPDSDNDQLPDDWELTYFNTLDHDGTADSDADGHNDFAEFRAGTSPVNSASILQAIAVNGIAGTFFESLKKTLRCMFRLFGAEVHS